MQNGYSRSFKVICFDVDEKPLGDYILRHNNFLSHVLNFESYSDRNKQQEML